MSSDKRWEEGGGESRRETESHFLAYLIKVRWTSERESSLCSGSSAAPLIQGKVGNGGSNSTGPTRIVPSLAERSCSPSANWQSAFGHGGKWNTMSPCLCWCLALLCVVAASSADHSRDCQGQLQHVPPHQGKVLAPVYTPCFTTLFKLPFSNWYCFLSSL